MQTARDGAGTRTLISFLPARPGALLSLNRMHPTKHLKPPLHVLCSLYQGGPRFSNIKVLREIAAPPRI